MASTVHLTPITWEPSGEYNSGGLAYSFPDHSDAEDLIDINLMPSVVEDTFEDCKLPQYVEPYWSPIQESLYPEMEQATIAATMVGGPQTFWEDQRAGNLKKGRKVKFSVNFDVFVFLWSEDKTRFQGLGTWAHGQLKILRWRRLVEGWVEAGESQRRPGLHVDSPGEVKIKNGELEQLAEGQGDSFDCISSLLNLRATWP